MSRVVSLSKGGQLLAAPAAMATGLTVTAGVVWWMMR